MAMMDNLPNLATACDDGTVWIWNIDSGGSRIKRACVAAFALGGDTASSRDFHAYMRVHEILADMRVGT